VNPAAERPPAPPAGTPHLVAAPWVLPICAPPIADGVVAVEAGRIAWVGPRAELPSRFLGARFRAFPGAVVLPGWVNAHSHLNLTGALGLLSGTAEDFPGWARQVIAFLGACPPHLVRQSVLAGLDLLASAGTTTVAHVSTRPELGPFLERRVRAVVFHEAIGFPAARAPGLLEEAREWLEGASAVLERAGAGHVRLGLAAHAPYSTSAELIAGVAGLARAQGVPFSLHLAETRGETEFLRTGQGPFRELLEERNAWDPAWQPPGLSPVRYAAALGVLGQTGCAVHCNYVDEEELGLLARARLTPVWCPGSHRFFGHAAHPAPRLLGAGARLALGTDSLASNRGLDMLREVRLAAAAAPEVSREAWLRAATLDAAAALGLGHLVGSLEPGKAADLQVVGGVEDAGTATDPLAVLFEGDVRVRWVLVDGVEMRVR
jgi:cytosine/adenosine deaminase-related metal-dependent hydrolase